MKHILALIASLALSSSALGNQVFAVATKRTTTSLEDARQRTEVRGNFRDFQLSLSVVAGRKGTPLESISGAIDGTAFQVDLKGLPEIQGVRASAISVSADCCIFGAFFYWHVPYGEVTRCKIDTPNGIRRGRARNEVEIEVNGDGKVENVRVFELCIH